MADEQPKASMAQVKQIIRRTIRRRPEEDHQFLNIYPMIDMMVILLVFLIMQFAASAAAAVQETNELRIPYSTSEEAIGEAPTIQISRRQIAVVGDREGGAVVTLRDGQVDPSDKQGGGTGFLIIPLYQRMQRVAEQQRMIERQYPNRPFLGEVQIIADRRTPFRTLAEVIYTLGQCGFKNLRFVVNRERG